LFTHFPAEFEQIATLFSTSVTKKIACEIREKAEKKNFSDSRGNRQANWNLDNFFFARAHLFTPCNLPRFRRRNKTENFAWRRAAKR